MNREIQRQAVHTQGIHCLQVNAIRGFVFIFNKFHGKETTTKQQFSTRQHNNGRDGRRNDESRCETTKENDE